MPNGAPRGIGPMMCGATPGSPIAGRAGNAGRLTAEGGSAPASTLLLARELEHRDPSDRMIAAQAMVEGETVASRDEAMAEMGGGGDVDLTAPRPTDSWYGKSV
jgi:hypothetical protein